MRSRRPTEGKWLCRIIEPANECVVVAFDSESLSSFPVLTVISNLPLTLNWILQNMLEPRADSEFCLYLPEHLFKPTQTHPPLLGGNGLGTHHNHKGVLNPPKSPQAPSQWSQPFSALSELQANWTLCFSPWAPYTPGFRAIVCWVFPLLDSFPTSSLLRYLCLLGL